MSEQTTTADLWHPRVLVTYFACVLVTAMAAFEPVCTTLALTGGLLVGFRLRGVRTTLQPLIWQLPLMAIICMVNPLFSAQGTTEVASIGVRKVYLESLAYGLNMGAMLIAMLVWFANAAAVISTDTLRTAFGSALPVVSLMVSMTMRLVPDFIRRGHEIGNIQRANTSANKKGAPPADLATRSRLALAPRNRPGRLGARGFLRDRRLHAGARLVLDTASHVLPARSLPHPRRSRPRPARGTCRPLPHALLLALPLVVTAVEDLRWSHAECDTDRTSPAKEAEA